MVRVWQPFLPNDSTLLEANGDWYFQNIFFIYCETNRRATLLFEDQQNQNDTRKCVTAIPGVADPTAFRTWDNTSSTVAVHEIMYYLLDSQDLDLRRLLAMFGPGKPQK